MLKLRILVLQLMQELFLEQHHAEKPITKPDIAVMSVQLISGSYKVQTEYLILWCQKTTIVTLWTADTAEQLLQSPDISTQSNG
jgi:hypothetical protein